MKKTTIILALILIGFASTTNAQNKAKFGHIDYAAIIRLIPGVDTAQKALEIYQKDLQEEGEQMAAEFEKNNAEYEALKENTNISPAVLKIKEDKLNEQYQKIEAFSDDMKQKLQLKQLELLKPFQDKLTNAIEKVAKEGNYLYIFDTSTILYFEKGDDIGPKVKLELGIKE
jgi:Skp family chaperone for outer membrane proteins